MNPGLTIRKPGSEEGRKGPGKLEHEDLTGQIIGAAIEVHRALGPGFIESVYENALVIALEKRGLKIQRQLEVNVYFAGKVVGTHRLDLLVEDEIIVDLKAVKEFGEIHLAIVKSQLRAVGRKHGLLLNFSKLTLEAKRVICS